MQADLELPEVLLVDWMVEKMLLVHSHLNQTLELLKMVYDHINQ
jgi:hypothetical protein